MTLIESGLLSSFRNLFENCGTLFKLEAELASMEMRQKAERTALLSAFAIGGGVIAIVGLGLLLLGFATLLALAFIEDTSESPLGAVGAAQIIVAFLTTLGGSLCTWISLRKIKDSSLIPRRAVSQMQNDVNRLSNAVRFINPTSNK